MSARSVFVLLRMPFSFFLLPIFLFGLVSVMPLDPLRVILMFLIIHVFLYPASNGFNSYYDRDEGPIGGILSPPRPTRGLLWASLGLDAAAIAAGFLLSPWFAGGMFAYGLFSKAYSWERLRLKRRPILSLCLIAFGQGSLIYLLSSWWGGSTPILGSVLGGNASTPFVELGAAVAGTMGPVAFMFAPKLILGAVISACFLFGVYPLTQVYQHEEDEMHGDLTYSRLVGVRKTFLSSAIFLGAAILGFFVFFTIFDHWSVGLVFLICMTPAGAIFLAWWLAVLRDESNANFAWLMRMNLTSSTGMNVFLVLELLGIPHF